MSIVYNGSNAQLIYSGNALGSDYPASAAFWFKADDETAVQELFKLTGFHEAYINMSESVSAKLDMWHNIAGPGWTFATTPNAITPDAWNHVVYIRASDSSQKVILNGGTAAEDTTGSRAWGNFPFTIFGATNYAGKMAEIAVWENHVLTAGEITALQTLYPDGSGITTPSTYIPGLDSATSEIGLSFTGSNTTYDDADHPSLSSGEAVVNAPRIQVYHAGGVVHARRP